MKKLILGLLAVMVAIIVVLCAVVAMQPTDFTITRTAEIKATPERVFEQVNDLHNWEKWSPWAKIDPNMKTDYAGPATGVGAQYEWSGNDQIGEGSMTITDSHPSDLVKIDLNFIKPFTASDVTRLALKPTGTGTSVTWTMSGHNNFAAKAFGLVINMDKMVGGDFERGLAQLKAITEAQPIVN